MANLWYYQQGDQRLGPVSAEALRALAGAGQIRPTDMVIREDMTTWIAANQARGLFAPATVPASQAAPVTVEPNTPKKASLVWLWVTLPIILLVIVTFEVTIILHNQSSQSNMSARRFDDSRRKATIAEISNLKMALENFELDNGRYPTSNEGLQALVKRPPGMDATWRMQMDEVPLDKWGHPFQYQGPDTAGEGEYNIISTGGDGEFGTYDDIDKFTRN